MRLELFDKSIEIIEIKLIVIPQIFENFMSMTNANGEMPTAATTDFGLVLFIIVS